MAKFKIRQIDAWESEEGQWYWNNSFVIGEFTTRWKDEKRAFLYNLHKLGILLSVGKLQLYYVMMEFTKYKSGKLECHFLRLFL